jgi:hypothetical protein
MAVIVAPLVSGDGDHDVGDTADHDLMADVDKKATSTDGAANPTGPR